MSKLYYFIHIIIYYFAWFACISLAAHGYVWISPLIGLVCVMLQLCWQYQIQRTFDKLWILLAIIVLISTLVDSVLVYNGIVIFAANPFSPFFTSPWMITMWLSFVVVLYATLSNLFNHLFMLGLLSFLGFFMAFRLGAILDAAFFPFGTNKTCFFIGVTWSIILPFCVHYYQKTKDN